MQRPIAGIAVDAAHSLKNGKTEYQGINIASGERIFYRDLGNQTTNIGEFLAIIAAVKYIIENDFQPRVIYSDSTTAITWFNVQKTSSSKSFSELQKAEMFLRALSYDIETIKVLYWDNKSWGETPADFNRK